MKKELVKEFLTFVKNTELDFIDYKTLMKECPSFKGMRLKDIAAVINSLGYSTVSNYRGYKLAIDTDITDYPGHNDYLFGSSRLAWRIRQKENKSHYYRANDIKAYMTIKYPFIVFEESEHVQNTHGDVSEEMFFKRLLEDFAEEERPTIQKFLNNYCTIEHIYNCHNLEECEKDGTPLKPYGQFVGGYEQEVELQRQGKYGNQCNRVSIDKFFNDKKPRTHKRIHVKGAKND